MQIAALFEETANNEKEHAKLWFKLLEGGAIKGTLENLKAAAQGENDEWTDMYPRMAKEAREEGFEEIANMMEGVAAIEKSTKSATANCWRTWKTRWCSHAMRNVSGSAPTVAISTWASKPQRCAQYATTHKLTSKSKPKTIDGHDFQLSV